MPNPPSDDEAGKRLASVARGAPAACGPASMSSRAPRSAAWRRCPPAAGNAATARLQREAAQQRLAEGVDRADPHAAGQVEHAGEQTRAPAPARWRTARARRPRSSASRAASSAVTQAPSRRCSRIAISAAAALVKVRHWMRAGSAPASISRSSRSVSSLVLPDPAEAPTKAETAGSDATRCADVACSRAEAWSRCRPSLVVLRRGALPAPAPDARSRKSAAARRVRLRQVGRVGSSKRVEQRRQRARAPRLRSAMRGRSRPSRPGGLAGLVAAGQVPVDQLASGCPASSGPNAPACAIAASSGSCGALPSSHVASAGRDAGLVVEDREPPVGAALDAGRRGR